MKKTLSNKNSIAGLFSMVLFAIFAVCIVAVLLMGINTYQKLNDRDQAAFSRRTCAHYLTTRVRQAADPAAVIITDFGDGDALVLPETYDGEQYTTYIYCSGGWLREYFTAEDTAGDPDLGEKILKASALDISLEDDLLSVTVTDTSGRTSDIALFIRGGKEALS